MNNQPIKVQSEETVNPEQNLWRAVLSQAIEDAFGPPRANKTPKQRKESLVFLTDYEDVSFTSVCEYAGFNPKFVKDKIEKTIDEKNIDRQYLNTIKIEIGGKHVR
jgi:hypothetical protein